MVDLELVIRVYSIDDSDYRSDYTPYDRIREHLDRLPWDVSVREVRDITGDDDDECVQTGI